MNKQLFVVIPLYNEEKWIEETLKSFTQQTDLDFVLILVENNSTDNSDKIIRSFLLKHPEIQTNVIIEPQKGTGSAADTGFMYAIKEGAKYIARTDADCIIDKDWIKNIKFRFLNSDVQFIIGQSGFRKDEPFNLFSNTFCLWWGIKVSELYGLFFRRDKDFKYNFILAPGHNLALTSDLYIKSGGFPRKKIEEEHDDIVLSERIRRILEKKYVVKDNLIKVRQSNRRYHRHGIFKTLNWYWNHSCIKEDIDVR